MLLRGRNGAALHRLWLAAFAGAFVIASAGAARAIGSVPPGWSCTGGCGIDTADGDVPLSPAGNSTYEWVSTADDLYGVGTLPGAGGKFPVPANGSEFITPMFSANEGDGLSFYFDYVTTDGAGYPDYAWVELLDSSQSTVTLLFTMRSQTFGSIVPGDDMPPNDPSVSFDSPLVDLTLGIPIWTPLGYWNDSCYSGCGTTGWVRASYSFAADGDYYLKFGVVNWDDPYYDSGLALDGFTITPASVPEPATWTLMIVAAGALTFAARRQRKRV